MRAGRPPSLDALLPCGFRFNPTDQELIDGYLKNWVRKVPLSCTDAIVSAEVYSTEPWNLVGEDEETGYFFSHRTLQNQKSGYTIRRAGSGTWYAEKKNPVIESESGRILGYKQMLSFCLCEEDGDRPTRKRKKSTGWVMYEYELPPINASTRPCEEPVLCLIKKSAQAISSSRKKHAAAAAAAENPTFPSTSGYVGLATSTRGSFNIADFLSPAAPSSDFDTTVDFPNPPCLSTRWGDYSTAWTIPMTPVPVPVPVTPTSDTEAGKPACPSSSDFVTDYGMPTPDPMPSASTPLETDAADFKNPPCPSTATPHNNDDDFDLDAAEFAKFLDSTLMDDVDEPTRNPAMPSASTPPETDAADFLNPPCPSTATPHDDDFDLDAAVFAEFLDSTLMEDVDEPTRNPAASEGEEVTDATIDDPFGGATIDDLFGSAAIVDPFAAEVIVDPYYYYYY
ncbi:uncharacterized protein [Typha angustifolia]|uniref:uncharacterized protein n=1 Tax=Typha angustifolia TaxID=59011 RepID=UPI003C2E2355